MNWSRAIFCLPYGDRWRGLRRMIAEKFTPIAVKTFFPVIETEVGDFLRRFETNPLGYKANIHRFEARYLDGIILILKLDCFRA